MSLERGGRAVSVSKGKSVLRTKTAAPLITLLTGAAALAACKTAEPARDYAEFRSSGDPAATAATLADNVEACWFRAGRPAFSGLIYVAELASQSNRPRILVVDEADPTGLPKLVIEASAAERGASVKLFGPLMATAEAGAIRRDVERWAGGASGC